MPSWTQHVTRLITVRYWIALILIALFVTASYLVMRQATEMEREGIRIVQMAAEQRVASQRICFLAHALADESDPEERQYYRSTLLRAVRQMEERNEALTLRGNPVRMPGGIRKLLREVYFDGAVPFDAQVDNFLKNAREVAAADDSKLRDNLPALQKINYAGSRQVMQTHKLIFELLKKEAAVAVDRIHMLGTVLWILTLILLAIEVPLIFRPMAQRAARSLNIMELARRKAQKDAAAAHAAREGQASFIRTMSHELRTPLNAILGMTQLMKMGAQTKKWTEYVEDIHQAGRHLLNLINDILEFSRLQAGQVTTEAQRTSLHDLLEQTISLLRPLAFEKNLKLAYHLDRRLAEYYFTDGPRIRQVLINLVGNAIKFTESGAVDVRAFYAGAAGRTGDHVRFEVEDSGIGVEPDEQDRIFQEFQQADASLARKYGGSGLGLAISSRLVQLLKGKIGVESIKGGGSVFWFDLPLERLVAVQCQVGEDPARLDNRPATSRLSILVAEQDEAERNAIETGLRIRGHQVRGVAGGREALLAAMESPPDVILIDPALPQGDGFSAIRAVRAIRELSGPAASAFIIALGGNMARGGAGRIMDAGADISVNRPVDFDVLHRYLMEFADGSVRARTA